MRRTRGRPSVLRRPRQGLSSLLLLSAMLALLGASFAAARPLYLVQDGGSLTGLLPMLLPAAGVVAYALAVTRLGLVRAHLAGAIVAAGVLLWVAGEALLQVRPEAVSGSVVSAHAGAIWQEAHTAITEGVSTPAITFLLLGAILWTTAQFSAFSVFRHDRGGPAVVAIGVVLFLNLALEPLVPADALLPPVMVLVPFTALALALLVRMQLVQQRVYWARRHIADTGEVRRLFLRSGAAFVAVAIVGATALSAIASLEPVPLKLSQLERPMGELGDRFTDLFSFLGVPSTRSAPTALGEAVPISDRWDPGSGTAFTATVQDPLRDNYWWGRADERYDVAGAAWTRTGSRSRPVAAGQPLPVKVEGPGRHALAVTVEFGDAEGGTARAQLFRPAEAVTVADEAVEAVIIDDGRGMSDIRWRTPPAVGGRVDLAASVLDYRPGRGFTAQQLRAADGGDPAWVTEKYLQGKGNPRINGPEVRAFIESVGDQGSRYDGALAVQDAFLSGDYAYRTEVDCDDYRSIPECVLAKREGFCTHYATTMVMVLREMGIPSRFITGYLPGESADGGESWTVPQAALHNWVEVYFPGYGWIRFDPTPGRGFGQEPTRLSDEQPTTTPDPGADSNSDQATDEPTPTASPAAGLLDDEPRTGTRGGRRYLLIGLGAVMALVLAVMAALLLFRLRRLPDGDGSLAYRGIVHLATRLGRGPHPAQTEYEYVDTLSETLPSVRDDLYLVAGARVESAYGRGTLDERSRERLRRAYARVRMALVRLLLPRR